MKDKKIKVAGVMALSEAVNHLENLLASLKEGLVVLESGQESMTLCPPPVVDLEIAVAQKKDKEKFKLELSWQTGERARGNLDLNISPK